IYHGDARVQNGAFEGSFIVPLEALTGTGGKVRAYVTDGRRDGAGAAYRAIVPGSAAEPDSIGPTITLRFESGTTKVAPDAVLRIVVRDEHGINLTGHTIPNALYLTLDGSTRVDLTQEFLYDPGSFQQGSVEYRLPNLGPGLHGITVSAADNYAQGVL